MLSIAHIIAAFFDAIDNLFLVNKRCATTNLLSAISNTWFLTEVDGLCSLAERSTDDMLINN